VHDWKGCCTLLGMRYARAACAVGALVVTLVATPAVLPADKAAPAIKRAQVWMPTDVTSMNITAGPASPESLPADQTIHCAYVDKKLSGNSPKFACRLDEEEVKVKFGGTNGEVFGEVAATRLLWALGFGADRMYPVRVICSGCPGSFGGILQTSGDRIIDPAAVEWKMPGKELSGWSWPELDAVDESAGGAPKAHRDALKLLAVFLQHTDNKPDQQRLICLDETAKGVTRAKGEACQRPFMLIQDLGLTFGRENTFNDQAIGAMNLALWSATPVWKPNAGKCIGNLPKSYTGTLREPVISEEGRQFLANLLGQLTDQQLSDLFTVARVTLRTRKPGNPLSGFATVDEWVAAFKFKRDEITRRTCA
jgi:hypothetical protein